MDKTLDNPATTDIKVSHIFFRFVCWLLKKSSFQLMTIRRVNLITPLDIPSPVSVFFPSCHFVFVHKNHSHVRKYSKWCHRQKAKLAKLAMCWRNKMLTTFLSIGQSPSDDTLIGWVFSIFSLQLLSTKVGKAIFRVPPTQDCTIRQKTQSVLPSKFLINRL